MQYEDFAINHCAVENSRNTFGCFQPQFEQAVAHRSRVWHAEIGAVNFHALCVPNEACDEPGGHRQHFGFDAVIVKSYYPLHIEIIANMLFIESLTFSVQ